jgi:predicted nucleic acid-binding protein
MNALLDTELLVDYLSGDGRAAAAMAPCVHRSITAITWVELMRRCPIERREATRAFLRAFERLSISESIADEAARLSHEKPGLSMARAINWASARTNRLVFLTTDASGVTADDHLVLVPYRSRPAH